MLYICDMHHVAIHRLVDLAPQLVIKVPGSSLLLKILFTNLPRTCRTPMSICNYIYEKLFFILRFKDFFYVFTLYEFI